MAGALWYGPADEIVYLVSAPSAAGHSVAHTPYEPFEWYRLLFMETPLTSFVSISLSVTEMLNILSETFMSSRTAPLSRLSPLKV